MFLFEIIIIFNIFFKYQEHYHNARESLARERVKSQWDSEWMNGMGDE